MKITKEKVIRVLILLGGPIIDFFNWVLTPFFKLITGMWGRVAICAFLVGPVAGFFMPINEKWIKCVCAKTTNG